MNSDWTTLIIFNALWPIGVGILTVLVHIVFANAVYEDAKRLRNQTRGHPILVGPTMWFLATLVGGVITAGIYWAMHHSRLSQTADEHPTETQEE